MCPRVAKPVPISFGTKIATRSKDHSGTKLATRANGMPKFPGTKIATRSKDHSGTELANNRAPPYILTT